MKNVEGLVDKYEKGSILEKELKIYLENIIQNSKNIEERENALMYLVENFPADRNRILKAQSISEDTLFNVYLVFNLYEKYGLEDLKIRLEEQISKISEVDSSEIPFYINFFGKTTLKGFSENVRVFTAPSLEVLTDGGSDFLWFIDQGRTIGLSCRTEDLNGLPLEILRHLEYLKIIKYNRVKELPDSIFTLANLKELDASRLGLESLSDNISRLQNLESLDLGFNSLKELPIGISKLYKLKYLNATGNFGFKHISEELSDFFMKLFGQKYLNEGVKKEGAKVLTILEVFYGRRIDKLSKKFKLEDYPSQKYLQFYKVDTNGEIIGIYFTTQESESENILCFLPNELTNLKNLRELVVENQCISHIPTFTEKIKTSNIHITTKEACFG